VLAFRAEVVKRRSNLFNYILFLRITPFVPNTFVNIVSPVVDIPFHLFAIGTCLVGMSFCTKTFRPFTKQRRARYGHLTRQVVSHFAPRCSVV